MNRIKNISLLLILSVFASTSVMAQDLRGVPPTIDDQRVSPVCPHKVPNDKPFPECNGRSNQECWDKCEANNYQDGFCRHRRPERNPRPRLWKNKPNPNGKNVIITPWGENDNYRNVQITDAKCLNPDMRRTGWAYVYANYCQKQGHWRNVNFNGAGFPGFLVLCRRNTLTVEILEEGGATVELEEVHTDGCNDSSFCVRGRRGVVHTFTFNTPFIYFEDVLDGDYTVSIDSTFNEYRSIPEFNAENGWNVEVVDGNIKVDGEVTSDLFYELDLSEVTLSRKGQNFAGRDAMLEYLETSDFYQQLGMNETEAQNSFGYVAQNLEDAPYYYLTIMDEEAVAQVSDLEITGPDGVVETGRRYFAIYPSQVEVTTTGDLEFPAKLDTPIKEYGEILVQSAMQVFWK